FAICCGPRRRELHRSTKHFLDRSDEVALEDLLALGLVELVEGNTLYFALLADLVATPGGRLFVDNPAVGLFVKLTHHAVDASDKLCRVDPLVDVLCDQCGFSVQGITESGRAGHRAMQQVAVVHDPPQSMRTLAAVRCSLEHAIEGAGFG